MSEPNRKVAVISTSVARTVTKEGVVPSALLLALKEQGFTVIIVTGIESAKTKPLVDLGSFAPKVCPAYNPTGICDGEPICGFCGG